MIFGLLYFCVVILCVNRSRSSFILYRIVKRHSRQSNVRRIWICADNDVVQKIPIRKTVYKCENVTASIKCQIVKTCYFMSRGIFSKCHFSVCFLLVSVTNNTLENGFFCYSL